MPTLWSLSHSFAISLSEDSLFRCTKHLLAGMPILFAYFYFILFFNDNTKITH